MQANVSNTNSNDYHILFLSIYRKKYSVHSIKNDFEKPNTSLSKGAQHGLVLLSDPFVYIKIPLILDSSTESSTKSCRGTIVQAVVVVVEVLQPSLHKCVSSKSTSPSLKAKSAVYIFLIQYIPSYILISNSVS